MGDIVVAAFKTLAAFSVVLLALGGALRSRALLVLGGTLLASVILTWILGLLGLPVGIVFGVLGGGAFLRSRRPRPRKEPGAPPPH
jgi:hypothetical protein